MASIEIRSPTYSVDLTESMPQPQTPSRRPTSPAKKSRIPPTPHREDTDAFWSQETTNDWIDQHSPEKTAKMDFHIILNEFNSPGTIDSPVKTPTTVAKLKSPSKTAIKKAEVEARKAEKARKQDWENRKVKLAVDYIRELDLVVSNGRVAKSSVCGYIPIEWSQTLRTTAGRAMYKRKTIRTTSDKALGTERSIPYDEHGNELPPVANWSINIILASHIITDMHRLVNTLTHEYCHLANSIAGHTDGPHGPSFKRWGVKCADMMKNHPVYGAHPIHVTTKHSYDIDFKYQWTCQLCKNVHGRHSKSIDPRKTFCSCNRLGVLVQTKPKPRKPGPWDNVECPDISVSEHLNKKWFNYPSFTNRQPST